MLNVSSQSNWGFYRILRALWNLHKRQGAFGYQSVFTTLVFSLLLTNTFMYNMPLGKVNGWIQQVATRNYKPDLLNLWIDGGYFSKINS